MGWGGAEARPPLQGEAVRSPLPCGQCQGAAGALGWAGQGMLGLQPAGPGPAQTCCCLERGLRPQGSVEAACARGSRGHARSLSPLVLCRDRKGRRDLPSSVGPWRPLLVPRSMAPEQRPVATAGPVGGRPPGQWPALAPPQKKQARWGRLLGHVPLPLPPCLTHTLLPVLASCGCLSDGNGRGKEGRAELVLSSGPLLRVGRAPV